MSGSRLAGKVAMVVGSARGIGLATVRLLAREGAAVALADIDFETAEAQAAEIRNTGAQAIAVRVDVGDEAQISAAVRDVVGEFGALHVLHNNAVLGTRSISGSDLDVVSMPAETWDAIQRVNLRGPMLTCKHAIPEIIRSGGGSIINTGSGLGLAGDLIRAAYAASKAGMYALTMHIATAYGRQGVRCNQVSPGVIMTAAAKGMPPDELKSIRETVMTPYMGTPEDIAEAVAYLASDASRYVTGQLLSVDGGYNSHQTSVRFPEAGDGKGAH